MQLLSIELQRNVFQIACIENVFRKPHTLNKCLKYFWKFMEILSTGK